MKKSLILAASMLTGFFLALPTHAESASIDRYVPGANITDSSQLKSGKYFIYSYSKGAGAYIHWTGNYLGEQNSSITFPSEDEVGNDKSYVYDVTVNEDNTISITTSQGIPFVIKGAESVGKGNQTPALGRADDRVIAKYNLSEQEVTGQENYDGKLFYMELANAKFDGGTQTTYICSNGEAGSTHIAYWHTIGDVNTSHYTAFAFYEASLDSSIPFDTEKNYFLKLTDLGYYLQLESGDGNKATVSDEVKTPITLIAGENENEGRFAIKHATEERYLSSDNSWTSQYNSPTPYYWSLSYYDGNTFTIHQNTAGNSMIGPQGESANGTIWTDNYVGRVANGATAHVLWQLEEVPADKMFSYSITFKYKGQTVETRTISALDGENYVIEVPEFFTTESGSRTITGVYDIANQSEEVSLDMAVPFEYSAPGEPLIWQVVRHHSNKDWIWKYTQDNNVTLLNQTANRIKSIDLFEDSELWAFVGDMINGFTIYNKAAGTDKVMYSNGTNVLVGESTSNNKWFPTKSDAVTNTETACCFKLSAQGNPMNAAAGGSIVMTYGTPDAGSTCLFFAPNKALVDYCNSTLTFSKTGVVGAPAGSLPDLAEVNAAKEQSIANPYDQEKTKALAQAIANLTYEKILFDDTKWYRVISYYNGYMRANDNDAVVHGNESNGRQNHNTIVKFEPVDATSGRYHIAMQGQYLGHVSGTKVNQVASDVDCGEFEIIGQQNPVAHVIFDATGSADQDRRYLHTANSQNYDVVGWDSTSEASIWYLEVANDLDVNLTDSYNGGYIGSGYFPFPVKPADGAKLYYIFESVHNDTNQPVMTYREISSVPAYTPFIIMNENALATLNIDYESISSQSEPENILAGTLRSSSATVSTGDYILNEGSFVKSAETPTVNMNSAWIPSSVVSNPNIESFELVNPESTSIIEIGVNYSNGEVIYDLQGRRVAKAVKGIYIINGVKTLVK